MVLLRRVIGDALRSRRQGQHRTLREVSTAANVSLGYLSEIERGQKEASSELLSAICEALGAQLSELLRDVSDTVALAEQMDSVLVPVGGDSADTAHRTDGRGSAGHRSEVHRAEGHRSETHRSEADRPARAVAQPRARVGAGAARSADAVRQVTSDGTVSVSIRQQTPLKATLRATRKRRQGDRGRDVVCAA